MGYKCKRLLLLLIVIIIFTLLPNVESSSLESNLGADYSSGLNIWSPTNTTYNSNSLSLNITAKRQFRPEEYDPLIIYSLNGAANVTVPSTETFYDMSIPGSIFSALVSYTLIEGSIFLPELSDGTYVLRVFGIYNRAEGISSKYPAVMYDVKTVHFTVNDGVPPVVEIFQFENKTFFENDVPLSFIVDEQVSWMGYSLDGEANVTVSGNVTLNGLPYGDHNLIAYANDTVGNMGATGNITFTIAQPPQFPVMIIGSLTTVIVVIVGSVLLILHAKKRRR